MQDNGLMSRICAAFKQPDIAPEQLQYRICAGQARKNTLGICIAYIGKRQIGRYHNAFPAQYPLVYAVKQLRVSIRASHLGAKVVHDKKIAVKQVMAVRQRI